MDGRQQATGSIGLNIILDTFIKKFFQARHSLPRNGCHSSSSGVSSDLSSEDIYPLPSSTNKENTGRVKVRNNMSNPPPKPKIQFLTPSQDNGSQEESLYAGNRTYQELENIGGNWEKFDLKFNNLT